jgi:small-conductance mechanosensitive channel
MKELLKQAMSLSLFGKCVAAIVGILVIHAGFRILEQTLPRRFGRADSRYKVRKFIIFSGYITILLFLALLFEDHLGRLSFAIGVIGAGVAVALQDVLASLAGAFAIGFSKLYMVGDRVQIGDTRGDVIDIGLLRTTLMETGNWVSKDMYNGRLVRIPNSAVLKGPIFNYSQGFPFIWDEIKVVLTTSSDCQFAKATLTRVAKEVIGDYLEEAQISWKAVSDYYETVNPSLEPQITLTVNGGNLEFGVSYIVDYTKRTNAQDQLFTKIVQEVANSDGRLQWASAPSAVAVPAATPGTAGPLPSSPDQGTAKAAASH